MKGLKCYVAFKQKANSATATRWCPILTYTVWRIPGNNYWSTSRLYHNNICQSLYRIWKCRVHNTTETTFNIYLIDIFNKVVVEQKLKLAVKRLGSIFYHLSEEGIWYIHFFICGRRDLRIWRGWLPYYVILVLPSFLKKGFKNVLISSFVQSNV